jgi:hypothetical protein
VDSQITKEIESDAVLNQIVLSHSGRMMFLGSSSGKVRSMRFPLTTVMSGLAKEQVVHNNPDGTPSLQQENGDFQEHQGHSSSITKMRVSYDDQFLFTTSEDGCLYVFKISDKDSRSLKRDREIIYADEVKKSND